MTSKDCFIETGEGEEYLNAMRTKIWPWAAFGQNVHVQLLFLLLYGKLFGSSNVCAKETVSAGQNFKRRIIEVTVEAVASGFSTKTTTRIGIQDVICAPNLYAKAQNVQLQKNKNV